MTEDNSAMKAMDNTSKFILDFTIKIHPTDLPFCQHFIIHVCNTSDTLTHLKVLCEVIRQGLLDRTVNM